MGAGFVATASKFRYQGQRHTNEIKLKIEKIHEHSLAVMLQTLVDPSNWAEYSTTNRKGETVPISPNFTGETQASFRLFRDYLRGSGIEVELHDFTLEGVRENQFRMPKKWNIPAKISNLSNADVNTAAGARNIFLVNIQSSPFKIKVKFETGAFMFQEGSPLFPLWEKAKAEYKKDFTERLALDLFNFTDFSKSLVSKFNRVEIRSK